ncbi:glycosyltransferase family 9 protein [Rhodanobacter sp. IGA1.0]|uniref:Glycosyltransferase family 9 protein n=1 Tax=Rhodanobacter sp. IGA1.0 TaxID=3158582 RepID=A0AAU7QNJ4_9GAMM
MTVPDTVRSLVATPLPAADSTKPPVSWDARGRAWAASILRRRFRRVGRALCEPGGLPPTGIHRVLVCRPNHRLGNSVLISPLIAEIEALYPGAEIDILGSYASECLYAHRFSVRTVFALPAKIARHPWLSAGVLRALRRCRYDLAIDACNGSQSGRIALALAQARYKLGFPDPTLNPASAWHALSWPDHLAHRGVFLLRQACARTSRPDYPPLNLDLAPDEKRAAARVMARLCDGSRARGGATVAIFPNATGAKCYGEDWWQSFVDTFESLCPKVRLVDLLAAHGRSQLGSRLTPFYSQNLRRLAAMTACMDGVISADCGVMHLAAASGTPTLGLFSVTDPAKYAPYGGASAALDTRGMDAVAAATAAAQWCSRLLPRQGSESLPACGK